MEKKYGKFFFVDFTTKMSGSIFTRHEFTTTFMGGFRGGSFFRFFKDFFAIGPRMPVMCSGYGAMFRHLQDIFRPFFLNFSGSVPDIYHGRLLTALYFSRIL